jgi:hypothetical protein
VSSRIPNRIGASGQELAATPCLHDHRNNLAAHRLGLLGVFGVGHHADQQRLRIVGVIFQVFIFGL